MLVAAVMLKVSCSSYTEVPW